jgi:hypothetical protein
MQFDERFDIFRSFTLGAVLVRLVRELHTEPSPVRCATQTLSDAGVGAAHLETLRCVPCRGPMPWPGPRETSRRAPERPGASDATRPVPPAWTLVCEGPLRAAAAI